MLINSKSSKLLMNGLCYGYRRTTGKEGAMIGFANRYTFSDYWRYR